MDPGFARPGDDGIYWLDSAPGDAPRHEAGKCEQQCDAETGASVSGRLGELLPSCHDLLAAIGHRPNARDISARTNPRCERLARFCCVGDSGDPGARIDLDWLFRDP